MAFNEAILRGLLKTLPVDGVPDLIVSAVHQNDSAREKNEDSNGDSADHEETS